MPEPGRNHDWRLGAEERDRGLRRAALQRRRLRGELCAACADERPEQCTNEGNSCPLETEADS